MMPKHILKLNFTSFLLGFLAAGLICLFCTSVFNEAAENAGVTAVKPANVLVETSQNFQAKNSGFYNLNNEGFVVLMVCFIVFTWLAVLSGIAVFFEKGRPAELVVIHTLFGSAATLAVLLIIL